ncbi:conserved hypothetical protein [Xenorhabdus bovienii str. Jollieti]|uniref:CdiI C-terminal domain-containing protein n=1 Tax=Xenorhabdus bovienii (strain SS-2004) TaxID=406818 RepID=D3UXB3_XENBS|nr:hypothetical protein [Xenorhabdus bovienii]CBJ80225.1 conserved hypothetical protein [Xenorhabdus bovienii SS-2004]CDH29933.1 conserved hypothetical protein [Xenorhabdus bovienii str. Jollieti]
MFNIVTKDSAVKFFGELTLPSSIIIDDFKEEFHLPITYWSLIDYKKSWYNALKEGLHKKNHAALAVSMYDPISVNFIFIWIIYFEGEDVFLQNQTLFIEDCQNFSPSKLNDFIDPRYTETENGDRVSEWSTDINSILEFYKELENSI